MTDRAKRTAVFLHQVEMGQPFYLSPLEKRAWVKLCPPGTPLAPLSSLPIQRSGVTIPMNGMIHVWIQESPD